jgi:SPP1 gp7 family putative phage head morphogenesis protein
LRLNDHSVDGAEFWDYGWLNHFHKAKSGYIARSGLHRVLCYPYLFKNYGIRDILEFLEIYGLPIRVGTYPAGATKEEKWTLLKAVLSIGRDAGGIIPQGMKIDFQNAASGDTDNHMSLIKWCEQTQSKIIVGGTLLSQADGKTSTNAQSKTHEVQFQTLIKSDAKQLARSITGTLIDYLMRLNFPHITKDRYPKFKFDTTDVADIETFSKSLPELVDVGMQIPVSWAHEKLGIPMPDDKKEAVLSRATQQSMAANNQQFKGFRLAALSQQLQTELFQDQVALDDAINQLDSGKLNAQAQVMIQSILKQLEAATTIDDALGIIANISPDRTQIRCKRCLLVCYLRLKHGAQFRFRRSCNSVLFGSKTLHGFFGQPPDVAIQYLENKQLVPSKNWYDIRDAAHNQAFTVANLARIDLLGDIKQSLVDAQRKGLTLEEWRNNITPTLQKKGWWGKDDNGRDMGNPWRLETIYRTNLQAAYMAGRRHEMLQATDTHPYWRYVAIMDNRTRPAHKALHGRVMRADDPAWDTIFPPCGLELPLSCFTDDGWSCRAWRLYNRVKRRAFIY